MHTHSLEKWQHSHDFSIQNEQAERRTNYVLGLTAITMLVEIIAGTVYGSMALLADGWHMATHVAAFLMAAFAYRYARKHAQDPTFTFGTGKVNVLGGFASAVALGVVALMMTIESLQRLVEPQSIQFNQAILVACLGLAVNLLSAWLLQDGHHHAHAHDDHESAHHHGHHHGHDHNLHAAYLHVIADALTSMLAIIALIAGKYAGWHWLDPFMGVVGALIISRWAWGLLQQSSPILLDASIAADYRQQIKTTLEQDADNQVCDMHIWKVGANHYAAIISLVTHQPSHTEHYKALLKDFHALSHLTIEVNVCENASCLAAKRKKP